MTAQQQSSLPMPSATQRKVELDVRLIPLALIAPDPAQPRKEFDGMALGELAESIKAHGVLQPILVRPVPASRPASVPKECEYLVIAGERRFRACHLAGLDEVPAQIRGDLTGDEIAVVQVLENLQRKDLSFAETARGVALLAEKITPAEAARQLGKDKSWISRHANVLKLRKVVVDLVKDGLIESADIAHELDSLFDLSEERGQQLAREFREPPHWRGTPPTRQAVRSAIDVEKQRIQAEKASAEEEERQRLHQQQQTLLAEANKYSGARPTPGEVTYRHPKDPALTWTGRGRMPVWVQEWQSKHGSLDGLRPNTASDDAAGEEPAKSPEQLRNEADRARANAEWKQKNERLEQLKAHAAGVSERLKALAMQRLEITSRPSEEDPDCLIYSLRGVDIPNEFAEEPVEVHHSNLFYNPDVSAERVEDIRYILEVTIDGATEEQITQLIKTQLGGGDTRYEQPGLRDLHRFIEEFTEPSPGNSVKNDWLFEQYGKWCKRHKLTPLSNQQFGEAMPRLGYQKVRKENGRIYLNMAPKVRGVK